MQINVNSEIGKLKKVLVHRPGKEVERLYPELFERLLFDDIMHLEVAQQEHDYFTDQLRKEGIKVYYIEKLVADVLDQKPELRKQFISDFLKQAKIEHLAIYKAAEDFFTSIKDNLELVKATIAGLKKSEIKPNFNKSLTDQIIQEDNYPFYIDPIPNILFQRDPIATIFNSMNLHNMFSETRKRERLYYQYGFKFHPEFKNIDYIMTPEDNGHIEGGDVLVINKSTIFVGISERTTAKAVEILASKLFAKYKNLKRIIGIEIPKSHATMHLDTVLTQMDRDKFSVDYEMAHQKYRFFEIKNINNSLTLTTRIENIKKILEEFVNPNVKIVVVGGGEEIRARREQWNDGANCLCIAPGKIVVYNRNRITNELIRKSGIETIEIKSSELSRGRGGPRCMSMPLEREEI